MGLNIKFYDDKQKEGEIRSVGYLPGGIMRAEVTFATASAPSSVKFDLVGFNM